MKEYLFYLNNQGKRFTRRLLITDKDISYYTARVGKPKNGKLIEKIELIK